MPTRTEMITEMQGYLHRSDTAIPWDTFVTRANERVGQDFRTTANYQTATLTSAAQYLLPGDFKEAIAVVGTGSGGKYALQPVSGTQSYDYFSAAGASSYGYQIEGGYLLPVPRNGAGDLALAYYAALVLPSVGTNLLLTVYPNAYLWYGLFQASLYIQDREGADGYLQLYVDEKDRANAVNRQKLQPISSVQGTTGIVAVAT